MSEHPEVSSGGEVATVERVILEARRQDDLRNAESNRVNGLFQRLEANLASEVRQIRELLTLSSNAAVQQSARAELVAAGIAERVDQSARALAAQAEANAKTFTTQLDANNERLRTLEQTNERSAGRAGLTNPLFMAAVGAVLAVAGGLFQKFIT